MAFIPGSTSVQPGKIRDLRWWIGGLLFCLDRHQLYRSPDAGRCRSSRLFWKHDFHWTNTDYANLLICFRLVYSFGRTISGRVIARVGTRRGLFGDLVFARFDLQL
jgi:ACS family hexuronate transporter-like MFS transporter